MSTSWPLLLPTTASSRHQLASREKCRLLLRGPCSTSPLAAWAMPRADVPQGPRNRQVLGRLGGGQHFVPAAEAHQHLQRHGRKAVGDEGILLDPLGAASSSAISLIDVIASLLWPAHHGGEGQHVVVVGHVDAVEALLRRLLAVVAVGFDRLGVGFDRLVPLAHAHVDVRRHVDQVTQARLEIPQSIGGGDGLFGMR